MTCRTAITSICSGVGPALPGITFSSPVPVLDDIQLLMSKVVFEGTLSTQVAADFDLNEEGQTIDLGRIELLGGDVTGDDQINIFDLALIAGHYGTTEVAADLNGDGKVNIFDLTISASNYRRRGPVMIP